MNVDTHSIYIYRTVYLFQTLRSVMLFFLDHLLVLFQVALHPDTFKLHAAAARCCPVITPSTSGQFSVVMISLTLNLC